MNTAAVCLVLAAMACAACSASWPAAAIRSQEPVTVSRNGAGGYEVQAHRVPLSTDPTSPVAGDNEVMALAAHGGRLFAATDQWESPRPTASGQILVKRSSGSPWTVFERTQSLRVQAIDSFPIPRVNGVGTGHSLLITQAVVHGQSQIQWLLDGADSFTRSNSFALWSKSADVRSFGAHEADGVWSVYAGAEPTGVLRGGWSPTEHTLVFDPVPELTIARAARGQKAQKVTGFADCGGALYASINTKLFRRNDGDLATGVPRWTLVYEAPPVGAFNSGLRGLTCVTHDRAPALMVSTEGSGDVYRFDHLPRGPVAEGTQHLVPTLEFSPVPAIRRMLGAQGIQVPATGRGSIAYVIAAYNNFETVSVDSVARQLFGFEWGYDAACPSTRRCGPTAFGAVTYDAAACFGVRTDAKTSPAFTLRCLSGPGLQPSGRVTPPIRSGQALVSIRTIKASPFDDGRLYYGGYDCNFFPADGTAWSASATLRALHVDHGPSAEAP